MTKDWMFKDYCKKCGSHTVHDQQGCILCRYVPKPIKYNGLAQNEEY